MKTPARLLVHRSLSEARVDWVAARGDWPGLRERVWFLTKLGGAVVDAIPNKTEPRLRLLTRTQEIQ